MSNDDPELYTITLRPLPDADCPGVVRLRAALKCLLRSFGLRCVEIRPARAGESGSEFSETGETIMDIRQAFPSRFLQASDLQGQPHTVTILGVRLERMDDGGDKPVVTFQGARKGLVLNATNAKTIMEQYGPETGDWTGRQIVLFPTQTDFRGRMVDCIRVRIPRPPAGPPPAGNGAQQPPAAAPPCTPPPAAEPDYEAEQPFVNDYEGEQDAPYDDEVPF